MPILNPSPDKYEISVITNTNEFKEKLTAYIAYGDKKSEKTLATKPHFKYFVNYLYDDPNGLNAKTILLEKTYVSSSYLGDYINYYAHCYRRYRKLCKRIHFFSEPIANEQFQDMLINESAHKKQWDSYLGYIVIKPLPKGIIGATLLQPYKDKNKRYYTAVRTYGVNLFGKSLKVTTLPYQEQDGIVGSCASSALWFAFQRTAKLFHSPAPNPSDITLLAGHDSYQTGKNFPSSALEIRQICTAINSVGLISELRNDNTLSDTKWLRAFSYAYLRMGIPVLMGINIEEVGNHLITLAGYRFEPGVKNGPKKSLIKLDLLSDEISKFYAHDDQTGPFSKVDFIDEPKNDYHLSTSWWKGSNEKPEDVPKDKPKADQPSDGSPDEVSNAKAMCIIAPIDKTIRVNFENILEETVILDFDFDVRLGMRFTWDIFLSDSNGYKEEIRKELSKSKDVYPENAKDILFESLPQYVWVARALVKYGIKKYRVFDLIYDAIDVNYEKTPYFSHIYNESFEDALQEAIMDDEFSVFRPKRNYEYEDYGEDYPEDFYQRISKEHSVVSAWEKYYGDLPEDAETPPSLQEKPESDENIDSIERTAAERATETNTEGFHRDLKNRKKKKGKDDKKDES